MINVRDIWLIIEHWGCVFKAIKSSQNIHIFQINKWLLFGSGMIFICTSGILLSKVFQFWRSKGWFLLVSHWVFDAKSILNMNNEFLILHTLTNVHIMCILDFVIKLWMGYTNRYHHMQIILIHWHWNH